MGNYNDEHREMLKLKQGLIEKGENTEQDAREKPPELHGTARLKNELAYLKWAMPIFIIAAVIAAIIIAQTALTPKADIRVLLIPTSADSELLKFADSTEIPTAALEKLCPDFDGNGKVHADVIFIDLSDTAADSQYLSVQQNRFEAEARSGDAILIISDKGFPERSGGSASGENPAFVDFSGELPEERLVGDGGVSIAGTEFSRDIGCEEALLFVRTKLGRGSEKKSAQYRDRAENILKNIMNPSTYPLNAHLSVDIPQNFVKNPCNTSSMTAVFSLFCEISVSNAEHFGLCGRVL